MGWARIDDDFPNHPKVWRVGPDGVALFLEGLCHAAKFLTDGRLGKADVQRMRMVKRPLVVAAKLVESGLWEQVGDDFVIHDYHDYNPTAADARANKEWSKRRQLLYSDKDLLAAVRKRDGNNCRYCGREVNWADRRGACGGQFDHVIPRGPHTLENIVVSCRECNSGKGGRSPDECGYKLIPIQVVSSSELNTNQKKPSRAGSGARNGMGWAYENSFQRRRHPLEESPDASPSPDHCERSEDFLANFAKWHLELRAARYVGKHERDWPEGLRLVTAYTDAELEAITRLYLVATGGRYDNEPRSPGRLRDAAGEMEKRLKETGKWPTAA